ncbi:MAG: aminotransferase class I/II-fold pyridoxal phosphate-dependent enzyme [Dysgonamonadaceae bacterium]|nr:aminotransferase class I/II-fold pyridoxal phosphate-dependent enzyme [Dysgonamonadaceae bacterium]
MQNRIHLSIAHLSGRETKYIQEAFDSNWVTTAGHNLDAFEQELAAFLDASHSRESEPCHVLALNSGTAAIHLGLVLLGVETGDEVICQSFTYTASTNPIYYLGAKPVFVDSEPDTWNMSPEFLEKAIKDRIRETGKKPKVIIAVHLYGMPAKMDEILQIAGKYEIPVLEDAAEALGSMYKGIHCGTFGELAALSFNGNKIITTSGGGALLSKNEDYIKRARFLATQARDLAPHYQHSHVGYNYRMSNVLAGIGRGQMEVLPQRVEQRRKNNQFYRAHLSGIEGITFQTELSPDFFSNYWLTSIIIDPVKTGGVTREDLRLALEAANIESRPLWKPMHLQPVFADCPYYGDGTSERLFENGLCLPSGSILTEKDLDRIVENIRKRTNTYLATRTLSRWVQSE